MTTDLALLTGASLALQPGTEEFERTATFMAREFQEATAEIGRLLLAVKEQTDRLSAAFEDDEPEYSRSFGLEVGHYSTRRNVDNIEGIVNEFKRTAWRKLTAKLGIRNVMSVKKRDEFDRQLESGELPDINEQAINGILLGLIDQAKDFAKEAALEVFDILRPRGHWGGQYKTNDGFRVGRKVILSWKVESGYGGHPFRVCYRSEQQLTAIDGVFHLLDGAGIMREPRGPLVNAINSSSDGRGETAYFRFKCFKNHNLHLEMKRLDLVKELNYLAAGEKILGADMV